MRSYARRNGYSHRQYWSPVRAFRQVTNDQLLSNPCSAVYLRLLSNVSALLRCTRAMCLMLHVTFARIHSRPRSASTQAFTIASS